MQHPITLVRSAEPLSYVPETTMQLTTFSHEKVGVAEVKTITQQAYLRPAAGDEYIFVIATLFVTHEAQNALLKLFEEPPKGLSFQLVLPESVELLPTLLSRVGQEIHHATNTDDSAWEVFLAASAADRLKQIDAWQKSKDPVWLQTIVRGVHKMNTSDLSAGSLFCGKAQL